MRTLALVLTALIFVVMIVVTVNATNRMSIPESWPSYKANPWAIATLYDAYCGFIIYWLWVAYRERSVAARILWFILIMALGSIATSGYLFWQLYRLAPGAPIENALLRKTAFP